jgi:transposase-like protein
MPRKSFTPEQIIAKLRQIEVLISQGHSVAGGCRAAGILEQSYYRWRSLPLVTCFSSTI